MKKHLSSMAILSLSLLQAGEFHSVGGQSISMGGTGVASASGSLAGYYNPALLTQKKGVEVSIGVGLAIRENNIGEQLNKLSNLKLTETVDRIASNAPSQSNNYTAGTNRSTDTQNIVDALDTLKSMGDKNGVALMPTTHLSVQYDNMAVGIYGTSEIVVSANVDASRTSLIVEDGGNYYTYNATTDTYGATDRSDFEQHSLQYALDNNLTTANARGLALVEVPVSYAKAFDLPMGELSVGGSVKLMHGSTYVQTLSIDSKNVTDTDTLKANQKDSDNVGLDIGFLLKPSSLPKLQVGLVAKNLNSPEFDTVDGKGIKADLQVRTGLQYQFSENLDLAADLDLTNNKTLINGYESQMLGGGLNYHPVSWFALRGGLMQNLSNSNEGLVYTAGLALGVPKFQLDVSAQMSSNTGEYDGKSIPKYAMVNVALVSRW